MRLHHWILACSLTAAALTGCKSIPTAPPEPSPPPPATPQPLPPDRPPEVLPPDAVPKPEPRSRLGNPPFYEVNGRRYFVLPTAKGYRERGIASWYGPGFHAGKTSNGEPYDMHAMTAAHPTLPLPSYARVTNLKNGRSVVVRVNDRGPFKDSRIIDLSRSAAAKLDMIRDGTAFVEVEAITPDEPVSSPPEPKPLFVQAASFAQRGNAENLVQRLHREGIANTAMREDIVNGRTFYRVRVGPVPTVQAFDKMITRLRQLGLPDARLAFD